MGEQPMAMPGECVSVRGDTTDSSATEGAGDSGHGMPCPYEGTNKGGRAIVAKAAAWPLEAVKWMLSFPALLGVFLLGMAYSGARAFFVDPDVWWHIKAGQDILRNHHWPSVDTYSFTAYGTPWIAYEWLGEVGLSAAARVGGNTALFALLAITAAAVLLGLYYYGTLRSGNCKAGFVPAGLTWSLVLLSFSLRPQMFGYLFLVLLLIVLEKFRQGVSWPLWTLPAIFLAWVNTHGSFIVGIGVLTVYLVSGLKSFQLGNIEATAWSAKERMKLEVALLLSLAVLPITPYGTQLAVYPFDLMMKQKLITTNIVEWQQMQFDQQSGKLFLGVVALLVVLQLALRLTWRVEEVLLAMGGAAMACLHERMLLLFVPFLVPILATMMAQLLPAYKRSSEHYLLNAVLMAGVVAAMVHYFPSREYLQRRLNADFPVEAVAYLDAHKVPGPMLNTYNFGGYLLSSGHKTFIDGRGDLFERNGVMADYLAVSQLAPGTFAILDRYHIASCLLLRNERLSVALGHSRDWKEIYGDETSALFVRVTNAGSGVTERGR